MQSHILYGLLLFGCMRKKKGDLLAKCFAQLSSLQAVRFNISESPCMDSRLIGSNIAWYSRYQLVYETFLKCINEDTTNPFPSKLKEKVLVLLHKNAKSVIYTSVQDTIAAKLQNIEAGYFQR